MPGNDLGVVVSVLWYVARESSTRPPTGKLWRSFMRTADCPVIFLSLGRT
jgi:hypothetical protein